MQGSLEQNVDELEIWKLQFKHALELWKEVSNDRGLGELKKQMEGCMDTIEWEVEFIEVYAALLWPMNTDKEGYREKAKTIMRTLQEKFDLKCASPDDVLGIRAKLHRKTKKQIQRKLASNLALHPRSAEDTWIFHYYKIVLRCFVSINQR